MKRKFSLRRLIIVMGVIMTAIIAPYQLTELILSLTSDVTTTNVFGEWLLGVLILGGSFCALVFGTIIICLLTCFVFLPIIREIKNLFVFIFNYVFEKQQPSPKKEQKQ